MIKKRCKKSLLNKKNSKLGRISTLVAVVAIIIFIIAVMTATKAKGNGNIIVGLLGLCSLAIGVAGFIIGLKSFEEEDKYTFYSWVGCIANGIVWLGIIGIYLAYI